MRLILPGELAKHAISEGTKSVTKVRLSFDELLFLGLRFSSSHQQGPNRSHCTFSFLSFGVRSQALYNQCIFFHYLYQGQPIIHNFVHWYSSVSQVARAVRESGYSCTEEASARVVDLMEDVLVIGHLLRFKMFV